MGIPVQTASLPEDITMLILRILLPKITIDVDPARIRIVHGTGVAHFTNLKWDDPPTIENQPSTVPFDITAAGLLWSPDARRHPLRIWRQVCQSFEAQAAPYIWKHVWLIPEHHDLLRSLQHLKDTYGQDLAARLSAFTTSFMYSHWPTNFEQRAAPRDLLAIGLESDCHCLSWTVHPNSEDAEQPGRRLNHTTAWCTEALQGRGMRALLIWMKQQLLSATPWGQLSTSTSVDKAEGISQHAEESVGVLGVRHRTANMRHQRWLYVCSPFIGATPMGVMFDLISGLDPHVNLALDFSPSTRWNVPVTLSTWVRGCQGTITILSPDEIFDNRRAAQQDLQYVHGLLHCRNLVTNSPTLVMYYLSEQILASVDIEMVDTAWTRMEFAHLNEGWCAIRPALLRLNDSIPTLEGVINALTSTDFLVTGNGRFDSWRPRFNVLSRAILVIRSKLTVSRGVFANVDQMLAQSIARAFNARLPTNNSSTTHVRQQV